MRGLGSLIALVYLLVGPACNRTPTTTGPNGPQVGSETHWMRVCEDGSPCGGGAVCRCGVCTLPCTAATDCSAEGPLDVCAAPQSAAADTLCGPLPASVTEGVCAKGCAADADCSDLGVGATCESGVCNPRPAPAPGDPEAPAAQTGPVVRAVEVRNGGKHKADLLFLVDDSGSMCEEQKKLGADLGRLAETLAADFDYRVAVISTDMRTRSARGRFRNAAAPAVPALNCIDQETRRPDVPDTADCDAEQSPLVLGSDRTDHDAAALGRELRCRTTLGTLGDGFEAGLEALRLALSCEGPNAAAFGACCQGGAYDPAACAAPGNVVDFLRPDASLVVVVVSDEVDCSAPEGTISRDDNSNCEWDRDLLTPVSDYVRALRGLKRQPDEQIRVLAFVGERGRGPAGQEVFWDQGRIDPECDPESESFDPEKPFEACCPEGRCVGPIQPTCQSPYGIAFSGRRYADFAAAFGSNGCGPDDPAGRCSVCEPDLPIAARLTESFVTLSERPCLGERPACRVSEANGAVRDCAGEAESADQVHYAVRVTVQCGAGCAESSPREVWPRGDWDLVPSGACNGGFAVEFLRAPPMGADVRVEYLADR